MPGPLAADSAAQIRSKAAVLRAASATASILNPALAIQTGAVKSILWGGGSLARSVEVTAKIDRS
jgi:hypothetical protein